MARLAEMQDFDRARALGETTLVEGLENGGAALICKFHHALTDGIGGVQIAMTVFDLSEEHYQREPLPPEREMPRPSRLDGYRDAWRYDISLLAKAFSGAVKLAPRFIYDVVRQPVSMIRAM
jgi:diacylglycerol O-acyltransferase